MYNVYIDPVTHYIIHWDYFNTAEDTVAAMNNSWGDYKRYGDIVLSSSRGKRNLGAIDVLDSLPASLFTEL